MNDPVTFLFTDIEGSTRLAQELKDSYNALLEFHDRILAESIETNNGKTFRKVGDAFCAAFADVNDAVSAAENIQRRLIAESNDSPQVKVRIGLHTGSVEFQNGEYSGLSLSIAERVMSAAHGGQILVSGNVYQSLIDRHSGPITFRSFGSRKLKDLLHPVDIYQMVCDDLPDDFPPIKSIDKRQNNLPSEITNFVGRKKELREIRKMFSASRFVTLSGSGGTGKTRLAIKLASDVSDEYDDGVWLAELSQVHQDLFLAQEIANIFNLKDEPGKLIEEILLNYLRKKNIVIVLDNCEHLINECARLSEKLLRTCPGLKLLVTSREPLRIDGETIYRVPSLEHPDPKKSNSLEEIIRYEAVRLFIVRACAVNSAFIVSDENVSAIAEICYRLDGIPLAIELAAVRTKILSPEKICEKLDDRFRLLVDGKRSSLPRQKTLRALIDWSYDLLNEKEKILWQRLSVFNGSWNLEDAEGICYDEIIERAEIFEIVHSLNEKSIISYRDDADEYTMLESIKQYGIEKLSESGEESKIRMCHLNYYLKFCEECVPEMHGAGSGKTMDKIERDYQNIQSALQWSIVSNHKAEGNRMSVSLAKFWAIRGLITEGRMWLSKLMEGADDVELSIMANAKRIAGTLATQQGDNVQAMKFINESMEEFRKENDKKGVSLALVTLGLIHFDCGDLKKAKECLEECIELKREMNDSIGLCSSLNALGLVVLAEGDFENAKKCFEETMKIAEEENDKEYQAIAYNNIAQIYEHNGDFDTAVRYFRLGLEMDKELGNKSGITVSLSNLATVETALQNFSVARELYEETIKLSRNINFREGLLSAQVGMGLLCLIEKKYSEAKRVFKECLSEQKDTYDFRCSAQCLIGAAQIVASENDASLACSLIGSVKEKFRLCGIYFDEKLMVQEEAVKKELIGQNSIEKLESLIADGRNMPFEDAINAVLKL